MGRILLLCLLLCTCAVPVFADPITFNFNGTLTSPVNGTTSIAGTFTVDSVTGAILGYSLMDGSLTYMPSNSLANETLGTLLGVNFVTYTFQTPNSPGASCTGPGTSCSDLGLVFSYTTDFSALTFAAVRSCACFAVESSGTSIGNCLGEAGQPGVIQTRSPFSSGAATPAPEPSSLVLLGAGALAVLTRRRRATP